MPPRRAVDREHGLPADLEEVDVLHHRAAPVRQVQEIHARLIGVHRRFDRHAGHRLAPGEKQVEIVARSPGPLP